jgi:homoserine dehydrogenase
VGHRAEARWEDVLTPDRIDLVFEASPVDLTTGGAGLTVTRLALGRGIPVVLANKAPLVLAFDELADLSRKTRAGLKYSATVCGGLPVMNIATRDMVAGDILRLRGIFNATTNFILGEMASGVAYGDALAEAQRRGIAEADPSLDVGGWDTANKLLILANTLIGAGITLADIDVTGIDAVTPAMMTKAAQEGLVIKLIASAENGRFSVAPVAIPKDEFLGQCNGWEMAVELHTDIYGINYFKLWEREPVPTAASMLRDAVHLFGPKS